jgi:hypothetical protein
MSLRLSDEIVVLVTLTLVCGFSRRAAEVHRLKAMLQAEARATLFSNVCA